MEWLGWIIAVVVVTFVSSQIAHAYSQPPESKSHFHTHLETYEPVRTTDNIVMVQTTGSPPLTITVEDGVKVAGVVELRSA